MKKLVIILTIIAAITGLSVYIYQKTYPKFQAQKIQNELQQDLVEFKAFRSTIDKNLKTKSIEQLKVNIKDAQIKANDMQATVDQYQANMSQAAVISAKLEKVKQGLDLMLAGFEKGQDEWVIQGLLMIESI